MLCRKPAIESSRLFFLKLYEQVLVTTWKDGIYDTHFQEIITSENASNGYFSLSNTSVDIDSHPDNQARIIASSRTICS